MRSLEQIRQKQPERGELRDGSLRGLRLAVWMMALALGSGLAAMGGAQSQQGPGPNSGQGGVQGQGSMRGTFNHPDINPFSAESDVDPMMVEKRIRALNAERQKEMVTDTNKLLKLAKELNDEVASTDREAFTPEQLRKIAEIEKLARTVRERMTAGQGAGPVMITQPPMVFPTH
jgi:hypothetical protein